MSAAPLPEPGALLRQARKIIEREYARPLTPQRLARRLDMPRLAFLRAFRDSFGLSVADYLRRCRMRHAACLLGEGRSVHDTALLVGYPRLVTFMADYRREFRGDGGTLRLLDRSFGA